MANIIQQVEDIYDYVYNIKEEITRGGQGAVFRTDDGDVCVKIELKDDEYVTDTSNNSKYDDIRILPISQNLNVTKPLSTLKNYSGYIMRLLEDMIPFRKAFDFKEGKTSQCTNNWLDNFKDNEDFYNDYGQYITSGGYRKRIVAYLHSAILLLQLHSSGLVYCDFSPNNVFVSDKKSNIVWLIDSDNINYYDITKENTFLYILDYAPKEISTGKSGCTFYSDCFAFAISLFWQLTWTHPFQEPEAESEDDEDSDDFKEQSNRQDRINAGKPWIFYNGYEEEDIDTRISKIILSPNIRKCFSKTFSSEGINKPNKRATMFEWAYVLSKDLDTSIHCRNCEMDYDYISSEEGNCPWCGNKNSAIEIESKTENGMTIWKFVHEIEDGQEIHVPSRIIYGFSISNVDEIAFDIKIENNKLIITNFLDDCNFYFVNKNSKEEIYGKLILNIFDFCNIISKIKNDQTICNINMRINKK